MRCATAAEMRELDRATIEDIGIPGMVLMENAGAGVARAIAQRIEVKGTQVAVVCGAGNNGGDGYVIARHLAARGADVRIHLLAPSDKIRGDARTNLEIAERLGLPLATELEGLDRARVVVDAIFGTGLKEDVRGAYGDAIDAINRLRRVLRVAVDIPSGLDADTGHPHGRAVRADLTVTMGLPKIGLVTAPGFEYCGDLAVVDIGIPASLTDKLQTFLLEEADVARLVPARPKSGHKGTFGHLLVVAGSSGKTGAALLCGEAALRTGAGLVTLAARPEVQKSLEARVRELMTATWRDEPELRALARGKRAVALGPGIPTDDAMRDLVRTWAHELPVPMVIDADGLNLLAGAVDRLRGAAGPRLLTPHPGEMARLTDGTVESVQADRVATARQLAARTGAVVALKGARTVIAAPDGRAWINPTGNPGLGTGGTGDVLTGVTGSLLAQGLEPVDALRLAVYAHGRAADLLAAARGSERGLLAREVAAKIPAALTFGGTR